MPHVPKLVKVELKNLFRADGVGGGVFLGNDEKTFAIFIGPTELNALVLAGGGIPTPRPLTHNLLDMILSGFGIEVKSVVIADLVNDTFHATLTLEQRPEHEGGEPRRIELDCRPSDALVLAVMHKKEIFVTRELFEKVEDGTHLLATMREQVKQELTPQAEKKPAPAKPAEAPAAKGRKTASSSAASKGKAAGTPAPAEEPKTKNRLANLFDARDVEGINWGSLE